MKVQDLLESTIAKPRTPEQIVQALRSQATRFVALPNGKQYSTNPAVAQNTYGHENLSIAIAIYSCQTVNDGAASLYYLIHSSALYNDEVAERIKSLQPYMLILHPGPEKHVLDRDNYLRAQLRLLDLSKHNILVKLLTYLKENDCHAYHTNAIRAWIKACIKACRECDRDYPEFKAIEKSLEAS